jgi:sucrose-6-phosphate hydrolase SacC (GH32 family)
MALPRNLSVEKSGEDWILIQHPVTALSKLRMDAFSHGEFYLRGEMKLNQRGKAWEMHILLEPGVLGKFTIRFAAGKEHHTDLWYDTDSHVIHFDRSRSGNTSLHPEFLPHSEFSMPADLVDGKVDLDIFFDNSIVEIYAQHGRKVLTAQVFPEPGDEQITLISEGGATKVLRLNWWRMKSAW